MLKLCACTAGYTASRSIHDLSARTAPRYDLALLVLSSAFQDASSVQLPAQHTTLETLPLRVYVAGWSAAEGVGPGSSSSS